MDLDVQENKSLNHDQNQNKLPQKKQNKTKQKTKQTKFFLVFLNSNTPIEIIFLSKYIS